jgi:dTDP-4-amino-4,6-dideoxygalactose transaminase
MSDNFLPFSKPSINQAAINEVVDCLQSGWITTGPRVKLFEAERIISLPLFPDMSDNEQNRVIATMKKIFNHD